MAKYKMYFLGLICHIGDRNRSEKRYAALVRDPNNEHMMAVLTEQACQQLEPGQHVRFGDYPLGEAGTDKQFQDEVPSLSDIMGGTLRLNPAKPDGDLAAFVHFPAGGRLGVAATFKRKARHKGKTERKGSVARLTVLEIDADELFVTIGNQRFDFGTDRAMLVGNVSLSTIEGQNIRTHCKGKEAHSAHAEEEHHHNDASKHFNMFGELIDGEVHVEVTEIDDAPSLPKWIEAILEPQFKSGTNIGCGNTNWP